MSKIIVTGGNGQLGKTLKREMAKAGMSDVDFIDVDDLDIIDLNKVMEYFAEHNCDLLINCAAYTAVDNAETDCRAAFQINGTGPLNLALAAKENGFKILHISTDYVFSGEHSKPYTEDEIISEKEREIGPLTVYGRSKLLGENAIALTIPEDHIIIRTSWLYSEYGRNFFKTMLDRALSDQQVKVVADQKGSPTYAGDLARAIIEIVRSKEWHPGTYHFCDTGVISWYEFASVIYEAAGKNPENVTPITTSEYPTRARRPKYSALDTHKIRKVYNVECPGWRDSLNKITV